MQYQIPQIETMSILWETVGIIIIIIKLGLTRTVIGLWEYRA